MQYRNRYPQKLFEIGTIFNKINSITEETHLCAISSHKDANYSEIKSVLQSVLQSIFGKSCETKTTTYPSFKKGHVANVTIDGKIIGIIGEIDEAVKTNFKIREPIVSFEVKLPS